MNMLFFKLEMFIYSYQYTTYSVNKFLVVNLFIFFIIDYFNYKTALQLQRN